MNEREVKAEVWIPLTQGKVAVIDFEDFEKVRGFKWHLLRSRNCCYAARHSSRKLGKRKNILMHREILSTDAGLKVDHWDRDGLNNRRSNLRPATEAQNQQNREKPKNKFTSDYKGVFWRDDIKKWTAATHAGKKATYAGCFLTEAEAARAYDTIAKKQYGEFARLNFPEEKQNG